MEKSEGIFSGGNIKSHREFQKAVRGVVGNEDKAKAQAISDALKGKTLESSGLSRKEAEQGLKSLKAEGRLTQKDIDKLKRRF